MLFEPNSKLVMIGDSITDCGRNQPAGEGLFGALGNGYVNLVDALITANYPELNLRIINKGLSGNRSRDLKARWDADVIDLNPDYVSMMIGTNDIWRQFDSPTRPEEHVLPDEYRSTVKELVQRTIPKVKRLILMTSFYVEPLAEDAMRKRTDEYGQIIKEIALETGVIFVDTQAAFAPALSSMHSSALAWDRVHPTTAGHAVLAKAFLDAVGFSWR